MNARERFDHATQLVEAGEYADATRELVWLWDHMLDEEPSLYGVRGSYLVGWMKHLADLDENARCEFTALRDKLTHEIHKDSPDLHVVADWFNLNDKLLEDHDSIGKWIDRLLSTDPEPDLMRVFRKTIHKWLCSHARWADAGRLLEPGSLIIARARLEAENEKHESRHTKEIRQSLAEIRLSDLAREHASFLAAGRDEEAWAIAKTAVEVFDSEQACNAIREMAQLAGVESEQHSRLGMKQRGSD